MPAWLPDWTRSKLVSQLIEPPVLLAISVCSVVLFILSLLFASWALRRLPEDFLLRREPPPKAHGMALFGDILRNLAGIALFIVGVLMLVLPGQGLLTMLAALTLMDFPGKRRLEQRLLLIPRVLATVNRLRRHAGRPALRVPDTDGARTSS
jgi:hypothetical protein